MEGGSQKGGTVRTVVLLKLRKEEGEKEGLEEMVGGGVGNRDQGFGNADDT